MNKQHTQSLRTLALPHTLHLQHRIQTAAIHLQIEKSVLDMSFSVEGAEHAARLGYQQVILHFFQGVANENANTAHFEAAVRHFHKEGVAVLALIALSTYWAEGDYADKSWYARDPFGNPIYHRRNSPFVVPQHPEWRDEIKKQIKAAVDCGVDGVVFYAISAGAYGLDFPIAPLGIIGSYDEWTSQQYQEATSADFIPQIWNLARPKTQAFLQWRTEQHTKQFEEYKNYLAELAPDVKPLIMLDSPFSHNLYVNRGIDFSGLVKRSAGTIVRRNTWQHNNPLQDVALLAWLDALQQPSQTIIDLGLDTKQVDTAHPVRHYLHAVAESIAMHVPWVVNGMTVRSNGTLSSLLHRRYEAHQLALMAWNKWQDAHPWLESRQNVAPIAVLCPTGAFSSAWTQTLANLRAVIETFQNHGLPIRIVTEEALDDVNLQGIRVLICTAVLERRFLDAIRRFRAAGGKLISVGTDQSMPTDAHVWKTRRWRRIRAIPVPMRPALRQFNRLLSQMMRVYHQRRWVRRMAYWSTRILGLRGWFQVTEAPSLEMQHALLSLLPKDLPRIDSETPILFSMWRGEKGDIQYHVVNQSHQAQQLRLDLNDLTMAMIYTPGDNEGHVQQVVGSSFLLTVDIMKILRVSRSTDES